MRRPITTLALLCALVASSAPALAATTRLVPEPGRPNTARMIATLSPSFNSARFDVVILGSSALVTTFDPVDRTLRIDEIAIEPGPASVGFAPKIGICIREMTFQLPEGSAPPQAAVDAQGHFALRFPVVLAYVASTSGLFCTPAPGSLTATWDMTGTFSLDPTSGRTRLSDVTVTIGESSERKFLDTGTLVLNLWDGVALTTEPARFQHVGDSIELLGSNITPGTILKVYVNTPGGVLDVIPEGLAPAATTPTGWKGVLPWPWPLPAPHDVELGFGVMQAVLVRTDRGFDRSHGISRVLIGNPALGVPSLLTIGPTQGSTFDPTELAPSSWSPGVALTNIENALIPGQAYAVGGSSSIRNVFNGQDPVVNIFAGGATALRQEAWCPPARAPTRSRSRSRTRVRPGPAPSRS